MQVKQKDLLQDYLIELLKEVDEPVQIKESKESIEEPADVIVCEQEATEQTYDSGWREKPLQCLTFAVGELHLAAPLAMLSRVQPLQNISPIYSKSSIYLGLMTAAMGNQIRVVDTMKLIMPEKSNMEISNQYSHVILAEGKDWGLAVTGIADSLSLQPDDVQWRPASGKTPWFAGTVVDRMCALLDIQELDKLLTE